jgi:hypothetical protein
MTVKSAGNGLLTGLYTDTKPVAAAGTRFIETDTGDILISDGTHWWLTSWGNPLSRRKVGLLTGTPVTVTTTNLGMGLFSTLSAATGNITATSAGDSTNGRPMIFTTGATTGNRGGYRIAASTMLPLVDPKMRFRFRMSVSSDYANSRMFYGFINNAEPTGDTPFDAGAFGVAFGFRTTDTKFQFYRNDTTGTGVYTDTGVVFDTAVHEVKIVCTLAGTKWSVSFDGGAYTDYTTEIPGTTSPVTPTLFMETNENASKIVYLYQASITIEK